MKWDQLTIHLGDENRTDYLHICIYVYVIVIHFVYVKQPPELRIGTLKYTLATSVFSTKATFSGALKGFFRSRN